MKTVHWLFVVSVALFVSGIGFIIASARGGTPDAAPAPVITPVASVKQIMKGIVGPAAKAVFESVGTIIDEKGVDDRYPRNDAEWEAVGNSAMALIESGNLMMLGNRAVDNGQWLRMSRAMMSASEVAMKAIDAKDKDALLAAGDGINMSCDNCHREYQRQ